MGNEEKQARIKLRERNRIRSVHLFREIPKSIHTKLHINHSKPIHRFLLQPSFSCCPRSLPLCKFRFSLFLPLPLFLFLSPSIPSNSHFFPSTHPWSRLPPIFS